jgi:predicted phosphodiesterase
MKVALLGDIHGNHLALQAVLTAARSAGVDKLLITGDLVGYYFWPERILELLEPWDKVVVRGNHEQMLVEARKEPELLVDIERRYGSGLRLAIENLSVQQLEWLGSLPHPHEEVLDDLSLLLCHGAPWDLEQYIYPDADSAFHEKCAVPGHHFVILGHTHYPMVLERGDVGLINPGSVGQPRNRQPGAQWALLDTDTRLVALCREDYDYCAIALEAAARHPELPYLSEVLLRT